MTDLENIVTETAEERQPLLEVRNLRKAFPIKKSLTGKVQQELIAVDDVSFKLYPGETLGIVGESGCGKTTLGRTILKLHPSSGGEIIYDGKDITKYSNTQMRSLRTEMQIIFQDPYGLPVGSPFGSGHLQDINGPFLPYPPVDLCAPPA